jgi:crotonobetainyl-CoA:carnitine CoA-transferase CaiB-like acyl-CoA transferase
VLAAIGEVLMQASAAQWVQRLAPLGLVVAEVGTLDQALDSPLTQARGLVVDLGAQPQAPGLRAVGSAVRFEGYTPSYGLPPLLDEHRSEVLGGAWP